MKTCVAIWTAISLSLVALPGWAAACEDVFFDGAAFTVCTADPAKDDIRLGLDDDDGDRIATFNRLENMLAREGATPVFAMNAGMYHPDRRPVGLYVEDDVERARIVTRSGPGNFGLLPNGVLCLGDTTARVIESRAFERDRPACRFATQSGPMLVIDGDLHPRFLVNSSSTFRRNGVGILPDGRLAAAISNVPVTFHHFARLFRDQLGTQDALFLDGNISRLYAPDLGRHDIGFPMGPMLFVVAPGN